MTSKDDTLGFPQASTCTFTHEYLHMLMRTGTYTSTYLHTQQRLQTTLIFGGWLLIQIDFDEVDF